MDAFEGIDGATGPTLLMWNSSADIAAVFRTVNFSDINMASSAFGGTAAMEITTLSLAEGQLGAAYSGKIYGCGGPGNYAWSVVGGALPPGLTLSTAGTPGATLAGTPTQAGLFNFTVKVQSNAMFVQRQLELRVE